MKHIQNWKVFNEGNDIHTKKLGNTEYIMIQGVIMEKLPVGTGYIEVMEDDENYKEIRELFFPKLKVPYIVVVILFENE